MSCAERQLPGFAAPDARSAKVLVVDADDHDRRRICTALERAGMVAVPVNDTSDAARALYAERPDATVLAIDPADPVAFAQLRRIRELDDLPVLVASSDGTEGAKVAALRAGADDFVTRPLAIAELVARVEANLRRHLASDDPEVGAGLADGLVTIDFAAVEAHAAGIPLDLTPLEFRLLATFVRHRGAVLSPVQLLEMVWDRDASTSTTRVKIAIGSLRQRFADAGVEPPIETVRGFGYRYRSLTQRLSHDP